ncbi:MAG: methyltransferase domain-containing protein, partial [Gammaproteobacteria bacterium]|nr:methyltransferase domain-containing protein [Gammaproteobacteria bacterium]NIW48044.1 methyltransferase domain-containing protein [Gammaproteobacteria bacterium]
RQADSDGQVIGIESNSAQIEEALRQAKDRDEEDLVELRLGSAYNMPLRGNEWGSFDVVHTRFLLEHLQKPSIVVQEMVKAARSGGRIILEDDDHDLLRFYPEPPGVQALWDAYMRTYDRLGNDPYIGRRLVWLLHQAGARPVRNTWLFFGSCSGEPNFDTVIDNMIGIVGGAREIMINDGLIDPQTFDEGIESLHNWKQRRDAAMWFGFAWAEGVKP